MAEIKTVNSILLNKAIPATSIFSVDKLALLKVTPIMEFKDGKFTDTVIGHAYDCVELDNYNKFRAKVKDDTPVIPDEELQELRRTDKKVFVTFRNLTITQYINSSAKVLTDSFKADGVFIIAGTNDFEENEY